MFTWDASQGRGHRVFLTVLFWSLCEHDFTDLLSLDAEGAVGGKLGLATGGAADDGLAAGAVDDGGGVREGGGPGGREREEGTKEDELCAE